MLLGCRHGSGGSVLAALPEIEEEHGAQEGEADKIGPDRRGCQEDGACEADEALEKADLAHEPSLDSCGERYRRKGIADHDFGDLHEAVPHDHDLWNVYEGEGHEVHENAQHEGVEARFHRISARDARGGKGCHADGRREVGGH